MGLVESQGKMTPLELATQFCTSSACHRELPCNRCRIQSGEIEKVIKLGVELIEEQRDQARVDWMHTVDQLAQAMEGLDDIDRFAHDHWNDHPAMAAIVRAKVREAHAKVVKIKKRGPENGGETK